MARDYKHAGTRPQPKGLPGWAWMLSGLTIGLFVALLVYLKDQPNRLDNLKPNIVFDGPSSAQNSDDEPPAAVTPEEESAAKEESEAPRFDFFTLLPEMEVVIPEGDYRVETIESNNDAAPSPVDDPLPAGTYVLQAGSFRQFSQADALKARLALLGVIASIQKVQVNDGDWHRVRIGPIHDPNELDRLKSELSVQGIQTFAVKMTQ